MHFPRVVHWMVALAAVAFAVVVPGVVQAQVQELPRADSDLLRRALITDKAAYLPMPAVLVCGPRILNLIPNGNHTDAIIVRRIPANGRQTDSVFQPQTENDKLWQQLETGNSDIEILLWGPMSRRAMTLWDRTDSVSGGYAAVRSVYWLGSSRVALVHIEVANGPLTRVSLDHRYEPMVL